MQTGSPRSIARGSAAYQPDLGRGPARGCGRSVARMTRPYHRAMRTMKELPEHVRANREAWDRYAEEYVEPGRKAWSTDEVTWGIWGIPEASVQLLPDVAGQDVIELGCGTGY